MADGPKWITAAEAAPYELIKSATVIVTNDDLITLPSATFEIIEAPGEGKIILPQSFFITSHIAVSYTNIGDRCILNLPWFDGVDTHDPRMAEIFNDPTAGFTGANDLLQSNISGDASTWGALVPAGPYSTEQAAYSATATSTSTSNQSLVLYCGNFDGAGFDDLGNLTGGDADNFVTVDVLYWVKTL